MSRWFYSIDLPQTSDVHVCLHQEDPLIGNNSAFKDTVYCSLLLYEKTEQSLLKPLILRNYSHNREVQFNIQLKAGVYIIIPFINSQALIKRPKDDDEDDFIVDIFKKLDLLMRRELKYPELVPFFKICNHIFDQDIFY